jgi:hypothetical protein
LEVRWPGGGTETLSDISVNRFVTIREGEGVATTRCLPTATPGGLAVSGRALRVYQRGDPPIPWVA